MEFFELYRSRIVKSIIGVAVIVLSLLTVKILQENKKAGIPVLLSQAGELFSNGKYDASLEVYKDFVKQFSRHKLAPSALLGIAYCNEELGNKEEAKKYFSEIKDKYPDSLWADDAVKGIERLG